MTKSSLFSLKRLNWVRDDLVLEILFLSILIMPLLNIIDVLWLFTHESLNEWNVIHTPLSVKIIKDILLVTLLAILFFRKTTFSPLVKKSIYILAAILGYAVIRALILKTPILIILSGIRWYLPVFLFPLFTQYEASKKNMVEIYQRYKLVILLAIPLQILQIFFSSRWNIREGFIYSRANGFFSQPQPMSLFALFFLIIVFEAIPEKRKKINYFIVFISIALTKSAAGVLGLGSLYFTKASKKYKIAVGIITLITILAFPYVTGRIDYWESPLLRFKILTQINLQNIIFGSYSNTCNSIQQVDPTMSLCLISDSFITSTIGNLGLILGLAVLSILMSFIYLSKRYYLFPIFILFLISANLTEYFPLNILFPFIIGLKVTEETEELN